MWFILPINEMKTPWAGLEPLPCKHEMTPFAAKLAQFNYLLGPVHVY